MPEIANPPFRAGVFISEDPTAQGVVAVTKGDGTVAATQTYDRATGDVSHKTPAGTNAGGGTRRHLFDREVYVDSTGAGVYVNVRAWGSITGTPTTVQGYGITNGARCDVANIFTANQTVRTGAVTVLTLDTTAPGSAADASYTRYQRGGASKWSAGLNRSGVNGDTYDVYDEAGTATRFRVAASGIVVPNGGSVMPGNDNASDQGSASFRWRNAWYAGAVTIGGGLVVSGGSGSSPLSVTSANAFTILNGGTTAGQSFGLAINAGTGTGDTALLVRNGAGGTNFLAIRGDGQATFSGPIISAANITVAPNGSGATIVSTGRAGTNDSYVTFWNNAGNTQLGYLGSDASNLYFARGSTPIMQMTTSGLFPASDNAYDLGSTSTRWRDANFAGRVKGGTLDASVMQLADWNFAKWSGGTITVGGDASQFNAVTIQAAGTAVASFTASGFYPASDNAFSTGLSSNRWTAVYAVNGTIQTSTRAAKDVAAVQPDSAAIMAAVRAAEIAAFTYKVDPGVPRRVNGDAAAIVRGPKHRHFGVMLESLPVWMQTTDDGLNPMNVATLALAGVQDTDRRIVALEAELAQLRGTTN